MRVKDFPIETGTAVKGRLILLGRQPFVQGDVCLTQDGARIIPTRVRVPNLSQHLDESGLKDDEPGRTALFANLAAQAEKRSGQAGDVVPVTPTSEITIIDWERLERQEFDA